MKHGCSAWLASILDNLAASQCMPLRTSTNSCNRSFYLLAPAQQSGFLEAQNVEQMMPKACELLALGHLTVCLAGICMCV